MIKKYIFLFLLISSTLFSQDFKLSPKAEISILTMGPGDELYDSFGHSAFRVKDSVKAIDIVYNYGVYDFNTPNFYTKFARGKLLYNLAVTRFLPFYNYYKKQDRSIHEQILNLSPQQTQAVFNYLQNNAKPENRAYRYDFLYDNCATKIRDVLVAVLDDALKYSDNFVEKEYTFRQLIQKNVYWNSWGSLGMDVAIGAVTDKKATPWEYQFLPKYVKKAADKATIKKETEKISLVKTQKTLYETTKKRNEKSQFLTSPLFVFLILSFIIVFITFKDAKSGKRTEIADGIIFFTTGLTGVFLLLLWFATDHSTTAGNYNMLWAFPLNLLFFVAISRKKTKKWLKKYTRFLIIMLFLLGVHWVTGVQEFAKALLPLFLALFYRYLYLVKVLV